MAKQFTLEDVQTKLAEHGYVLLSPYTNLQKPITIKDATCTCGQSWSTCLGNILNRNQRGCVCQRSAKRQGLNSKGRDEVAQALKELGAELLTSKYLNQEQALEIRANCGHTITRSWKVVRMTHQPPMKLRCDECRRREVAELLRARYGKPLPKLRPPRNRPSKEPPPERPSRFEAVKTYILSLGGVLLSTQYENQNVPLEVLGFCGHRFKRSLQHFKINAKLGQPCECPECLRERNKDRIYRKYTTEDVQRIFREYGGEPLFQEYSSYSEFLPFTCGHPGCTNTHVQSLHKLLSRKTPLRCPNHQGRPSYTTEQVRAIFLEKGATPLFERYRGYKQNLEFICSQKGCENRHCITLDEYNQGKNPRLWCQLCSKKNRPRREAVYNWNPERTDEERAGERGAADRLWKRVSLLIHSFKCQLTGGKQRLSIHHLDPYSKFPLRRTAVDNSFVMLWNLHSQTEARSFHALYGQDGTQTREHFLEFCQQEGYPFRDYWTVSPVIIPQTGKFKTQEYAQAQPKRPLLFFEPEVFGRESLVAAMIQQRNKTSSRFTIPTRKLKVVYLDSWQAADFYGKNHIQGKGQPGDTLALTDGYTLYAAMTVRPYSTKTSEPLATHELSRFAVNYRFSVPGAASKLLKHHSHRGTFQSLVSYADLRFCDPESNVYHKLG